MKNIFTKQTIYTVEAGDLSELIQDIYGINPQIEASLELGHDDNFQIDADGDEFNEEEWNDYIIKQEYERDEIYNLMHKLCLDGHIVKGVYLIQVW